MKLRLFALAAVLSVGTAAHAWNATGHMVVAAVAQANLDAKARAEVDRLLKIGADLSGSDDFISVAPWADEIRNQRRETGGWHYKDIYFREDGKSPINHPDEPNAVSKIVEFTKVIGDKAKPDAERADALRFLIHLVGDIHQPLHATSRESDALPKGDRGGNDFHILPPDGSERGPKNLHSLWDGGAGLFTNGPRSGAHDAAITLAKSLSEKYTKAKLKNESESNPEKWAEESFADAKTLVYKTAEGQAPTPEYIQKAQAMSGERVTIAGYRLADLLNRILG
jgi:hypothetical protein